MGGCHCRIPLGTQLLIFHPNAQTQKDKCSTKKILMDLTEKVKDQNKKNYFVGLKLKRQIFTCSNCSVLFTNFTTNLKFTLSCYLTSLKLTETSTLMMSPFFKDLLQW